MQKGMPLVLSWEGENIWFLHPASLKPISLTDFLPETEKTENDILRAVCFCVCVCVCVCARAQAHFSTFKISWLTSKKEHFALTVYMFFKSIKQDGGLAKIFTTFGPMRIINELLGSGVWNFRYGYCSSLYQRITHEILLASRQLKTWRRYVNLRCHIRQLHVYIITIINLKYMQQDRWLYEFRSALLVRTAFTHNWITRIYDLDDWCDRSWLLRTILTVDLMDLALQKLKFKSKSQHFSNWNSDSVSIKSISNC